MEPVIPGRAWRLHEVATLRRIEAEATAALPPHTLMQRAGLAVARLALALAPHARRPWLACGPGNNGGDGLEAAMHLHAWGMRPVVGWLGQEDRLPGDAAASLQRARAAGVAFAAEPPPQADFIIDSLFGIGARKPLEGRAAQWRDHMARLAAPVLAVDLPSGLDADTGHGEAVRATHTLSLLALKPGLFTAQGRDAAGAVWFDDLGVHSALAPTALLTPRPRPQHRPHSSHKGSWGDVAVIGGAPGMRGAALLAGTAALHAGAGRVFVSLLGADMDVDPTQPDLMFRRPEGLPLPDLHVACGSGGGEAVRALLPRVLAEARSLVLDADALNAMAADAGLQQRLCERSAGGGRPTVLTPHPLEAARLLGSTAAQVQADRLAAARELAARFGAVVALKGSGTVIAAPGETPCINPTGNARLATAGTGDVLAGMVAARMAAGGPPFEAACEAVYVHGALADEWPEGHALTAATLARAALTWPQPPASSL